MNILVLMDMPLFPYRIYAYNVLANKGYNLTVVSVSNENIQFNIPLKFLHVRLEKIKIGGFLKLKNFHSIKPNDYDVIIVDPNLRVLDYYQLYRNKYWNKLIGWGHHKGRTTGNKLAEKFRFAFFKKFNALVFYDYQTKDEYLNHGFDNNKLYVANNTQYVDLSMVDLNSRRNCFIYVGRIQERKAIDLALEAFALVKQSLINFDLKFQIVGGGDTSRLKDLCCKLGIENNVIFTGPIHEEAKLAEIFNVAFGYVSPGHVGLGVLHSLAFGVPVITCKGRKHSLEVVNCKPDNSFLVTFNKIAIAEAMIELCKSEDLFKRMSRAAHHYYVNYCTIDRMVDGVDNAIKHIVSLWKK